MPREDPDTWLCERHFQVGADPNCVACKMAAQKNHEYAQGLHLGSKSESILQTAERIIHGDRQQDYGHPTDNHGRTATLWVTYIEGKYGIRVPIDPEDVCFMNVLQKIGREMHRKTRDGIVDIAGYAGNVEMIRNRDAEEG